jgi:hypothetical protein
MLLAELNGRIQALRDLPPDDAAQAAYDWACALLPVSAAQRTAHDCSALWMTALAAYVVATTRTSVDVRAVYEHIESRLADSLRGVPREQLFVPLVDFPPRLHRYLVALSQMPASVVRLGTLNVRRALFHILHPSGATG